MLAEAMNTLSVLSRKVSPVPAQALPTRVRRALPVAAAPAPVLRPQYMPPVNPPAPARKVRRQGAADRVVAAVTSRAGVLASGLPEVAGFPCGAAYLNRLAQSRGLNWWTSGEGAKLRYCGNLKPVDRR